MRHAKLEEPVIAIEYLRKVLKCLLNCYSCIFHMLRSLLSSYVH